MKSERESERESERVGPGSPDYAIRLAVEKRWSGLPEDQRERLVYICKGCKNFEEDGYCRVLKAYRFDFLYEEDEKPWCAWHS